MTTTILQAETIRGSQCWDSTETAEIDGFKVRTRVRQDSYAKQSFARAEVWSTTDLRWNEVATTDPSALESDGMTWIRGTGPRCVSDDLAALTFAADHETLRSYAINVLS